MTEIRYTMTKLTGQLRWKHENNGLVLEQEQRIAEYKDDVCMSSYTEWQPVPIVEVEP